MILNIGWKNVWRNKNRSMVVIIAVLLGIFGGVMSGALMKGWINQRIHSSIYNEISHVQIHNPEFILNEDMEKTILDYKQVASTLDTIPEVVAYSARLKIFALAKTDRGTSGLILKGVNPVREKQTCEIYKNLVTGEFLEDDYKSASIVIGSKAAESLKLKQYLISPDVVDTIDKSLFTPELLKKLTDFGIKRYRKEKDFRKDLEENLTKSEYKKYGDMIVEQFSYYRLGKNIQITLQNNKGQIVTPSFKVRGIYKTSNSVFDGMNAFVNAEDLTQVIGFDPDEFHEIAVMSTDNKTGAKLGDKLAKYFPQNNVMSWRKLSPEIAMYTDFVGVMGLIYVGIILLALAFGIINTMMMSVLDRIKELGMLMAVGMNKKKVFFMIMTESVFLTITGAIAGMIVSGILIEITGSTGINLNMFKEGFEALGYSSIVYPEASFFDYLLITVLVILTGIIAAIWPARKALKLNPVEALRTD